MDLRETESGVDVRTHWYYRTKRLPLERYVARTLSGADSALQVVDIGAGSGVFSDVLVDRFADRIRGVVRVDLNYPCDRLMTDPRLRGGVVEERRQLPPSIETSVILLMDVLEHVEDTGQMLRDMLSACRGRNHVFVTAPAFDFLWSGHDEFLGHHRRYSVESLSQVIAGAGIRVTSCYYLFGLLFPLVAASRLLRGRGRVESDLRPVAPLLNAALATVGRCDAAVCRFNRIAGVTAIVEGVVDA